MRPTLNAPEIVVERSCCTGACCPAGTRRVESVEKKIDSAKYRNIWTKPCCRDRDSHSGNSNHHKHTNKEEFNQETVGRL